MNILSKTIVFSSIMSGIGQAEVTYTYQGGWDCFNHPPGKGDVALKLNSKDVDQSKITKLELNNPNIVNGDLKVDSSKQTEINFQGKITQGATNNGFMYVMSIKDIPQKAGLQILASNSFVGDSPGILAFALDTSAGLNKVKFTSIFKNKGGSIIEYPVSSSMDLSQLSTKPLTIAFGHQGIYPNNIAGLFFYVNGSTQLVQSNYSVDNKNKPLGNAILGKNVIGDMTNKKTKIIDGSYTLDNAYVYSLSRTDNTPVTVADLQLRTSEAARRCNNGAIPEPTTTALLGLVTLSFVMHRKRRE
ncbi:MAG: PEP-CTERM sorting domain-containing protein [Akkermansia sp.]